MPRLPPGYPQPKRAATRRSPVAQAAEPVPRTWCWLSLAQPHQHPLEDQTAIAVVRVEGSSNLEIAISGVERAVVGGPGLAIRKSEPYFVCSRS